MKYTKEKMQTDIVESDILPIHELVIESEKYWIAYFDDFHNGYNLTGGGDGVGAGENHPMFGKKQSSETIAKKSGKNNSFFGKKRPEHSKWMLENMSGENHPMFGKKLSPETCAKMSEAKKGEKNSRYGIGAGSGEDHPFFGLTGENHPVFGYKHTPETIAKMSENMSGENNPMFGKTSPKRRPEYTQALCFFLFDLHAETDIKQKRKLFCEAFPNISKPTLYRWFRKWQTELESD